jgi:hypothetical protein
MLTLIFHHVLPLISNSFVCLLRSNRGENQKPVIVLHHLSHSGPIFTLFRHLGHRKPILDQPSIGEEFCQPFRSMHIVLNYNGHDLRRVFTQECFHFLQSVNCRLLKDCSVNITKLLYTIIIEKKNFKTQKLREGEDRLRMQ